MSLTNPTKLQIKEILEKKLTEKSRGLECPICKNKDFILADGFAREVLQDHLTGSLVVGGPSIPKVVVVCSHCGFVMTFAAGALGLLHNKLADTGPEESEGSNG